MNKNNNTKASPDLFNLVQRFSVPIMFILICAVCIPLSGLSANMLINEITTRMGRNAFLILSLLIPIMAGMGLNFGMTLGAMAAEIALIFVSDWQIVGIPGMVLAAIISVPISVLLGIFCGKILNEAKGREMITSYIMSFFINGIYQLVVLYLMGSIIPIKHGSIKLPRGYGQPARHSGSRCQNTGAHFHYHRPSVPVHRLVQQDQARPGYARSRSGYGSCKRCGYQCRAHKNHLHRYVHRSRGIRYDHLPAEHG